jgi:hypothetical protein
LMHVIFIQFNVDLKWKTPPGVVFNGFTDHESKIFCCTYKQKNNFQGVFFSEVILTQSINLYVLINNAQKKLFLYNFVCSTWKKYFHYLSIPMLIIIYFVHIAVFSSRRKACVSSRLSRIWKHLSKLTPFLVHWNTRSKQLLIMAARFFLVILFFKKRLPGVGSEPGSSWFHLFSHFHHFTAEPQRLLGNTCQNGKIYQITKYTKGPQTVPNVRKIDQMSVKLTKCP